jgi:adenylate cyclase
VSDDEDQPTAADHVAALRALGLAADTAAEAVTAGSVPLALVREMLVQQRPYSFDDVVAESGVPAHVLRERYRALGMAEHRRFGEAEVEEAREIAILLQVVPADALIRVLRIDGQALTRVALAHVDLVYAEIADPIREAGGDDVTVALALVEAYQSLSGVAGDLLRHSYTRILSQLLESELIDEVTRSGMDDLELSVGFADVVGYTSLSARVDPGGLEDVIEAFETRCYSVAGTLEGVQLVKFIGDAAMLVATEPVALATALLAIVARPDEASPLFGSPIKAGMAHGTVLLHGGDYFGPTVNLAARLTDRSRPQRVLADGGLAVELAEFDIKRVPTMHLRGIGRHKPLSVRLPRTPAR